jgi:PAH dioxygenase small subunit
MKPPVVDHDLRAHVSDFLFLEAELLDSGLFPDWLQLLDTRVHYYIPVRQTLMRDEGPDESEMAHIDDFYPALSERVERMRSKFNWAENPASRTRHHITNIRIRGVESAVHEDHITVYSNLLFYRSRMDDRTSDLVSCERQDVLVRSKGDLKLLKRHVVLDQSTLLTHNFAFFL